MASCTNLENHAYGQSGFSKLFDDFIVEQRNKKLILNIKTNKRTKTASGNGSTLIKTFFKGKAALDSRSNTVLPIFPCSTYQYTLA